MATDGRVGNNKGFVSPLVGSVPKGIGDTYVFRKPNTTVPLAEDRWYASRPYAIGKGDDLSIVLDNDVTSKRFDVPMSRRVSLAGGAYANTGVAIDDFDGTMFGPLSLIQLPLEDFALVMQPRVKTDATTTSEILWRWKGFGANNVGIEYDLQLLPGQTASWSVDYTRSANARAMVLLPTGAARSLNTLTVSTRIAVANLAEPPFDDTQAHEFWLMTGYDIATLQSDGTDTTVTIASPTGITLTGTGLTNGDTVYLTIDAGIPWIASGAYVVHTVSFMTFKVSAATGGAQGPTAGVTSHVTLDSAAGADWTNVQVGDTLVLNTLFSAPAAIAGKPLIVTDTPLAAGGARALRAKAKYGNAAAVTVPVLSGAIASLPNVQAFPSGDTITMILYGLSLDANVPFTGTNIGVGGSVLVPTWYAENDNTASFPFADGINYVKTTTIVPSGIGYAYTIDFKLPIDTGLTGYAQWVYEEAYLCPTTAANVASYLNQLAVCGLSANGKAETSSRGSKVQISTSTIGSVGSVQIRGGLANSALANVRGAATATTDTEAMNVVVPTTQTSGFHAGWPVKITNSVPYIKSNPTGEVSIPLNDLLSASGHTWVFGLFGEILGTTGVAWSRELPNVYWQIEKHGNFMAITYGNDGVLPVLLTFQAGDYVVVSNNGITDTVSADNLGTFVISAIDINSTTVYVENPTGVEEMAWATLNLLTRDSILPGDQIVVGSDVWGALNRRTFTVDTVAYLSDGYTSSFTTVEAISGTLTNVLGPQPTVQVRNSFNHKFVKTINSIIPLPEDPTYSVISFVEDSTLTHGLPPNNAAAIGENYGSQLSALCKLAFPVVTTLGIDGYAHSVGLVGEADKVMYGYETDPVSYPGVVAAGSNINISGPLVKRIQVGLSLRVRGTVSTVFEAVRGAVATFVNNSKVGESIAISDIIAVASSIGGVEAVSVSSPAYTTTADRITVQPYEKPLVLQPDLDVTLTLIG